MRLYNSPLEAYRETERELWEMGHDTLVQSMQDQPGERRTKELVAYGFQLESEWNDDLEQDYVLQSFPDEFEPVRKYIAAEFRDRISGQQLNPGNSWHHRNKVWEQFLHGGVFHYTYSERLAPQLNGIIRELRDRPGTRQAVLTIHANVAQRSRNGGFAHLVPDTTVDFDRMGGIGRVPCSLYYQFISREEPKQNEAYYGLTPSRRIDMIYAMRSCDFLTHHPIDMMLAMRMHKHVASVVSGRVGLFTYFTGSLHAYYEDMQRRGIF